MSSLIEPKENVPTCSKRWSANNLNKGGFPNLAEV